MASRASVDNGTMSGYCANCGKITATLCGGCRRESYCSRYCQFAKLETHNAICGINEDELELQQQQHAAGAVLAQTLLHEEIGLPAPAALGTEQRQGYEIVRGRVPPLPRQWNRVELASGVYYYRPAVLENAQPLYGSSGYTLKDSSGDKRTYRLTIAMHTKPEFRFRIKAATRYSPAGITDPETGLPYRRVLETHSVEKETGSARKTPKLFKAVLKKLHRGTNGAASAHRSLIEKFTWQPEWRLVEARAPHYSYASLEPPQSTLF